MEIWDWVWQAENDLRESGNDRLADFMDEISTLTCADEHDKVDQMYPEALALAKKEKNRWIEIFIRHWYLQSQVLHRHNVKGMVRDAVELLELSSQEDTKDCPQSICAVQDLANTYAQKDGVSYIQERISVSQETLARINPAWPCFECISDEYICALIDSDELDKALEEIEEKRKLIYKANEYQDKSAFCLVESEIYILKGEYKKAEEIVRAANNPGGGESFLRYQSALTAVTLIYQDKIEESKKYVLPFTEVLKAHSHFMYWAEYMFLLATKVPEENNEKLNYCLNTLIERFSENGVQRDTLEIIEWQVELATNRNDYFTADMAIEKAKLIIAELRADHGASEWLEKASNKLQEVKNKSPVKLHADEANEEMSLTELDAFLSIHPEDSQAFIILYDKLIDNGYFKRAFAMLESKIESKQYVPAILSRYGNSLLEENRLTEFDSFFNDTFVNALDDLQKIFCWWVMARRHKATAPSESVVLLEKILAIDSELENALEMLAVTYTEEKQYDKATDCWTRLIALDPKAYRQNHWDRMVSATLAENWESVRESCEVLEIQLDSESGPIDENFGSIRIQTEDRSGERIILNALRIGPVSARITEMFLDEDEQFYGDEVVFEATPLNRLDSKDDDGDACDSEGYYTLLYPIYKTQKKGSCYIFDFDGIHPGEEKWNNIIEVFTQNDCDVSVRTSSSYQVCDNETDEYLDAIYCYVAAESSTNLDKLNKDLFKVVKDLEYPFVWGRLASKVGDVALLELQAKHEERFGLG